MTTKQLKLELLSVRPDKAAVAEYQRYLLRKQRNRWHYTMQYHRRSKHA